MGRGSELVNQQAPPSPHRDQPAVSGRLNGTLPLLARETRETKRNHTTATLTFLYLTLNQYVVNKTDENIHRRYGLCWIGLRRLLRRKRTRCRVRGC